jgi:hypothetical protein
MNHRYNLTEIEERYRYFYHEAERNGDRHLPYYEIQPWDKILGPIELQVFHEIRAIGLPLYPIFPVAPGTYLHFANPFQRIGIEIAFKKTVHSTLERKQMLLKPQKWMVYTISSQYCYLTLEEFFRSKRTKDNIEFEDLSRFAQLHFFEKFRLENISCLLEHIKYLHFEKEYV